MTRTGGCHCGAVAFEGDGEPDVAVEPFDGRDWERAFETQGAQS